MSKEADEFLELCNEFIEAQRELEKNDGYVHNDKFSILYRYINRVSYKARVRVYER